MPPVNSLAPLSQPLNMRYLRRTKNYFGAILPNPRSRLNMVLCALDPEWFPSPEARRLLCSKLSEKGIVVSEKCGNESHFFIDGGFGVVQLVQHAHPTLVANHQGGYRVFCGVCGVLVTRAFVDAIGNYRDVRKERTLTCPECGVNQDLDHLSFQPAAAFTRFEVQLHDIQNADLTPEGSHFFNSWFCGFRTVLRRVG